MQPLRDLTLLLGRVVVGVVFIYHGWQKLVTGGIDGVAAGFGKMGIPLPTVSAWFTALVELVGGAAFIVGIGLPLVGVLFAFVMAGAGFFVHFKNGFGLPGGFEYILTLLAAGLALGFNGGRYSLDAVFGIGQPKRERQTVSA
ncbi:DoxX family protein [Crossiella cryophila]|uniref:Putative oxidoreductase n=1 Tax=Crossiella cryophila TaxID=43355 RepID=A0A7W7C749_9PSEU|nr:DoxX family protein [Crossiella cryophila]MBB4675794.1 putative oxidoreductase [Crossiella cryophila]